MNSETERAADLLESAAEIYRRLGVRHKQRNVLNNMALVHFARGDVDSALKLLFEALEIARTVDDPTTPDAAEKVTVNIGEAYYRLGEYVKSEKILSEGLANIADKPDSWTKLHMAASLARAKAKLGKKNEARALRTVIDRCIPTTQPAKQPDIYSSLAEIEFLTGDSIQGLRDLLRSRALTDTIESRQNAGVLRQLLVVYDTERLQSRNEALQNSVKNRTIIISIAIVAFMLLLGLLLALWAKLRTDRIVRLQSERIAEIERIEHQRKEEQLIDEIDTQPPADIVHHRPRRRQRIPRPHNRQPRQSAARPARQRPTGSRRHPSPAAHIQRARRHRRLPHGLRPCPPIILPHTRTRMSATD